MEKKESDNQEKCPHCGGALNSNVCIDGNTFVMPRTNDLTICMYCGQPFYFNELLQRVALTREQYRAMPQATKQILKDAWKIRAELIRTAAMQGKFDA